MFLMTPSPYLPKFKPKTPRISLKGIERNAGDLKFSLDLMSGFPKVEPDVQCPEL